VTDVAVERLRIACRAGRSRRAEALATRRRLEAVARAELPRALAARAHAWPDAELGSVLVALDFDPAAYDDVTVAVLWADRIGAAVERVARAAAGADGAGAAREGRAAAAGGGAVPALAASGRKPDRPGAERRVGETAPWALALVELALAGDVGALARVASALADPAARRPLLAAVPAGAHATLAARLEAASARPTPPGDPPGAPAPRSVAETEAAARRADGPARNGGATPPPAEREALRAAARAMRQAAPAESHAPRVRARSTLLASGCAGLVLTYPWLGGALERAAQERPALAPVAARRHALAAIAGDVGAAVDPLVRLLAGDGPTEPPAPLAADPAPEAAAEAAEAILRRLAEALPGFARSSPGFLQRELIVRPGTLDPAAEPVPVTLAPAPLDVLLPMLPYPIGLFRLPWTPPLTIRVGGP
jgi:hypothetical protein